MDAISDAPLGLSLAFLALLDALSIGTLLIPVFLLLAPRLRGGRVVLYLGTIAVFYLVVGVLFTLGLVNLVDVAQDLLSSTGGLVVRLVVGAALLITAFAIPVQGKQPAGATSSVPATTGAHAGTWSSGPVRGEDTADATNDGRPRVRGDAAADAAPSGGRITRWRDRLLADGTSRTAVISVALGAGLIEVATMLPYLVAMGMLAETEMSMTLRFAALAGYCAIMIAPALLLLALRIVAAPLVQRPLERLGAWLERTAAENTAWILGIVGFLVARSAASELGLFDALAAIAG
ncbi:MAG: GAP family protein [Agromyces sp.]